MKILFFYQYFGTPQGSWSTRVYELTKRWVAEGHEVTVVTAPYDKSDIKVTQFISKRKIEGINLIIIDSGDSNVLSKFKRICKAFQFSFISSWYSLTLKYDVCLASSGPITIGIPLILAKKVRNKPTIFEVRDLWPAGAIELGIIKAPWQRKLALWLEKSCYNSANSIVAASVGQKANIEKRFPLFKVDVIPNASDLALFGKPSNKSLPNWTKEKIIFTHIGSLGLIHNTNYWMSVAKELNIIDLRKEIVLVFIGDGKDKDMLIKEKAILNLENIHFLGMKPKAELPVWVQSSRATLFATLDTEVQSTCSPNKIFDSFAASIPIIQTSNGWIKEMVEKEYCGVNVNLKSPNAAAKKILWLAQNQEIAAEMGNNALRLAKGEFNRDKLALKYLNIIKRIVNE